MGPDPKLSSLTALPLFPNCSFPLDQHHGAVHGPLKPAPSSPSPSQLVRVLEESRFMGRLRGWQELGCLCQEPWP